MNHAKHKKHEHCEHEEVAYCGHCQVVYCKSCKREWADCKFSHGYAYYCGDTTAAGYAGSDDHTATHAACSHSS